NPPALPIPLMDGGGITNTIAASICATSPRSVSIKSWYLIPFFLRTSKSSSTWNTTAELDAFVNDVGSNPVNETAFSTPSIFKEASRTSCTTASVRDKEDPGGS